ATEAPTATTTTTTTTIISCNVADDVRNVLLPAAAAVAGEIEESNTNASQPTLVEHAAAAASSASTETETQTQAQTVANSSPQHTVKIQIANAQSKQEATNKQYGKQISVVKLNDSQSDSAMLLQQQQQQQQQQPQAAAYQLCYLVSSGQYSPCETLDSGTGSDLESKSPSSSSSQQPKLELHLKTTRIRVNSGSKLKGKGNHLRAYSLTDSEECEDESSSSLSCDSLHSNEAASLKLGAALLPTSLLRDIRDRERERERDCERLRTRARQESLRPTLKLRVEPLQYEADQFYNFHMNEHANCRSFGASSPDYAQFESEQQDEREDAFAGYKDMRRNANAAAAAAAAAASSTIRSAKGTVRGVKNRVRNGVATFLQLQQPNVKSYKDKDLGKVVLYTTSMGIIRDTYAKCANVKQILRTLLIKFEERDVFMSLEYQQEMRERMQQDTIRVPQLFVEGQHIGDADTVERLNESGELRQLLRPYKSIATAYTCQTCGGYRLLPCPSCNGSKKSMHRNHFTAEFMALKCMNCDEVGLVKCPNC
ncbi:CG12206, partial [Drosophila busckii]